MVSDMIKVKEKTYNYLNEYKKHYRIATFNDVLEILISERIKYKKLYEGLKNENQQDKNSDS